VSATVGIATARECIGIMEMQKQDARVLPNETSISVDLSFELRESLCRSIKRFLSVNVDVITEVNHGEAFFVIGFRAFLMKNDLLLRNSETQHL